jgi:hypothetical protein
VERASVQKRYGSSAPAGGDAAGGAARRREQWHVHASQRAGARACRLLLLGAVRRRAGIAATRRLLLRLLLGRLLRHASRL